MGSGRRTRRLFVSKTARGGLGVTRSLVPAPTVDWLSSLHAERVVRPVPVHLILVSLVITVVAPARAQAPAGKRLPTSGDFVYRLRSVSDPQLAPGGDWVAFTVTTIDSAK